MAQNGYNSNSIIHKTDYSYLEIRLFRYIGYAFFLILLIFIFYVCFSVVPFNGDFPTYLITISQHRAYDIQPHTASSFYFLTAIFYDGLGFPVEFTLRISSLLFCLIIVASLIGLQRTSGLFTNPSRKTKFGVISILMPALLVVFSPFFVILVEHSKQFFLCSLLCLFLYLVFKVYSSNVIFSDDGLFSFSLNGFFFSFLLLQIITCIFLSSMIAFVYFFLLIAIMLGISLHSSSKSEFMKKRRPFLAWLTILTSLASVESSLLAESIIKTTSPVQHTLSLFLQSSGLDEVSFLPSTNILLFLIPICLYAIFYFVPILIHKINNIIPEIKTKTLISLQIGCLLAFYVAWIFFAIIGETPGNPLLRSQFSFALIAIWVAWIAFQAVFVWLMRSVVKQNELITTMIVFAIFLCILVPFWATFDTGAVYWSAETFQPFRLAIFLVIPLGILGAMAFSEFLTSLSLPQIVRTFIIPVPLIVLALLLFNQNPLSFSFNSIYDLINNPDFFSRILIAVIIFLSTVKVPHKISTRLLKFISTLEIPFTINSRILKGNFISAFQSQHFVIVLFALQIMGIFLMSSLFPPLLTVNEKYFIEEELPEIIPKRSHIYVQPHFRAWLWYYYPDSYEVTWLWSTEGKTLLNFLENPKSDQLNALKSIDSHFYVIISNSIRGQSFLNFNPDKIRSIQNENIELIYSQGAVYVIRFTFENSRIKAPNLSLILGFNHDLQAYYTMSGSNMFIQHYK